MDSNTSLIVDGLSDIGNRRTNNEDAWWTGIWGGEHCFMEPGPEPLRLIADVAPVLLVVSDGMGGANGGEVASQMAVSLIPAELGPVSSALTKPETARGVILAAVNAANAAITARSTEPGLDGMGATLSLLCFVGGGVAHWAQAGDSRIYRCRHGKLWQISRDHSPVGRLRQQGKITEAEARHHPMRNQIDQSLGDASNPFCPDAGAEEVRPGDVFLLCSDGISDGLWDHEIERVLAGVRVAAEVRPAVLQLIASAKQASGRDNLTAVIALVAGGPSGGAVEPKSPLWRRLFG